jgi:hypothetical protein
MAARGVASSCQYQCRISGNGNGRNLWRNGESIISARRLMAAENWRNGGISNGNNGGNGEMA